MRVFAVLMAGVVLLVACQSKVTPHHFVIPVGYTGPIAVVADPGFTGKGGYLEQERYVHLVPQTAVVCVAGEGRLGPHLLSASIQMGPRFTDTVRADFVSQMKRLSASKASGLGTARQTTAS